MSELYPLLREALLSGQPVATATVIAGPELVGSKLLIWPDGRSAGSFGEPALAARVCADVVALLARGESRTLAYDELGVVVFVESMLPPPTLFMIGGVHIAVALATMAKLLGFHTVVIEARTAFATAERFAHVDELVLDWPDQALAGRLDARSCVAVLTHDPKLDDPALRVALASPACYIGVLGSRNTHARRLERLSAAGFEATVLARIYGPIGLPIGAKTAEEIAVSIMAQIVQVVRLGVQG